MASVFITGGTGTVGFSLVRGFVNAGYQVTFQFGKQNDEANGLTSETGAEGVKCNLCHPAECAELDLSRTDILINNAAINYCRDETVDVPMEQWQETLAINLTAPFLLCQAAIPGMMNRGWGRIINISSIYGLLGTERNLPYTVSKHGMSGMTKTVAREYGQSGITCNEICPGPRKN